MKKIFFALTLMFAFSISASAQEKLTKVQELSKNESKEIADLVGLGESQTTDLYRLFEMKNEVFSDASISDERKTEMARIVDLKIKASLNAEQMTILENSKELYSRILGKKDSK